MISYLNIPEDELKAANGYWTAREIAQQPDCWSKVIDIVNGQRTQIDEWLEPILAQSNLRIILTGAGTSAYVGETLAPALTKALGRVVEAISTTNLVSNPDMYFLKDTPTLLISYARSGNSPESMAACALADQLLDMPYQLAITCNRDSKLATYAANSDKAFCMFMPEETLDQSFAMTSSFTSMIMATLCIFTPDENQQKAMITASRSLLSQASVSNIKNEAEKSFSRIVFLGSGPLLGMATEARLKMLELTMGQVGSYVESPLGFRHGPKVVITADTMIVMLNSNDEYCKKYDEDLVRELSGDKQTEMIICLGDLLKDGDDILDDIWASVPYIVFGQILSFYKSLHLGLAPDNPCPSGEVNRVVQGVTIHGFEG